MLDARDEPLSKGVVKKPMQTGSLILEAWVQGFLLGALIIMACVTLANMRRGVLLHKLILIELLLCILSGTAIFTEDPAWGWYISSTGLLLYMSYTLHNVISWIKSKPFLGPKSSKFYISTIILVQPFWVVHAYTNFAYFNNFNKLFLHTRPLEAIFRDPWWIFTTVNLFWNVKSRYDFQVLEILRISPRFVVLLSAMCLSIVFVLLDILSVTSILRSVLPTGINPFWKLSFSFKCLTDTVILDDFKTALDKMHETKLRQMVGGTGVTAAGFTHNDNEHHDDVRRPPREPHEAKEARPSPPLSKPEPAAQHVDRIDTQGQNRAVE